MQLIDDKYGTLCFWDKCQECNYDITYIAPVVAGLNKVIKCDKCGHRYITIIGKEFEFHLHKIRQKKTLELYNEIISITATGQMTLRHLFYRLVSDGIIEKTENSYKSLAGHTSKMRRRGLLDYDVFADNTRWKMQETSYSDWQEALQSTARFYRQALWNNSPVYVEIWVEKDAISNILYEVTNQYDLPLMVARGFSSLTFLHSSASHIENLGKPSYIYHIGDHDPSGFWQQIRSKKR